MTEVELTEAELGRMDLGRNQYVVSLELGIFQGRPKSIRPNSETVKIRPMAQEADSTHFFLPISVHPPGTTATEAEAHKIEKYRELIDNGYIFQPVVLELQCSLGESSDIFVTRLCERVRDISSPAIWATIWRRSHGRQKCRPNGLIKLIN